MAVSETILSALKSGKLTKPTDLAGYQTLAQDILANQEYLKQYSSNVYPIQWAQSLSGSSDLNAYESSWDKLSQKFARAASGYSSKISDYQQQYDNLQSNIANVLAAGETPEALANVERLKAQNADLLENVQALGLTANAPVPVKSDFLPSYEATRSQKMVGHTGTKLDIQQGSDGTYTIIDALTGKQYVDPSGQATSGLTLQEADKLSNMLQSGGTADATGAFATQEETTSSLLDTVNATDGSLTANKEFVNGAFQAYLGRDATQAELDQYVGQTVESIRNALKAGSTGTPTTGTFDTELPETYSTDFLEETLNASITDSDLASLMGQMQEQQASILELLSPTAEEQSLEQQLVDLRTSYQLGMAEIEDQPIAMSFITGQQASLEKRAAILEANLLSRLGLEQNERAMALQAAQTELGYTQTNIDTYFKMQELIMAQENATLARAQALEESARSNLTMILETLQGIDTSTLTTEQKDYLYKLSSSAGVPYELVVAGLENIYNQSLYEMMMNGIEAPKTVELSDGTTVQWDSTTSEWKPISTSTSSVAQIEYNDYLQQRVDDIQWILDSDALDAAVGTLPMTRAETPWNKSERNQVIERIKQVINQETLDELASAKERGITFGALSESEMATVASAATTLSGFLESFAGQEYFDVSEKVFKEELQRLLTPLQKAVQSTQNASEINQFLDSIDDVDLFLDSFNSDLNTSQNGSQVLSALSKYRVGSYGGQCGEFVNDLAGIGVGDSYESKMAYVNSATPSIGSAFVMPYRDTGHIGFITDITPKSDGTVDLTVVDSNWSLDEKIKQHTINSSQVSGYIRI